MAYNTPPTVNGTTWSASDTETYICNNFEAGIPGGHQAKGDLMIGTAANAAARLPVGADGTVFSALAAETTGTVYVNINTGATAQYKVAATKTAGTGAFVIVQYDTVIVDSASVVTTGAAWAYTAPTTGHYLICASALVRASTAWEVNERCTLNCFVGGVQGRSFAGQYMQVAASGGYRVYLSGAVMIALTATNTVDVRLYQDSDSDATIDDDGNYGRISIVRLF